MTVCVPNSPEMPPIVPTFYTTKQVSDIKGLLCLEGFFRVQGDFHATDNIPRLIDGCMSIHSQTETFLRQLEFPYANRFCTQLGLLPLVQTILFTKVLGL